MDAISICNLTKRYQDVVAVQDLNMTVRQGELISLLGVNGAGKTTTVKMLSCLTKPTQGDALICGKRITTQSQEVRRLIGVCPQETAVAGGLTVYENLMLMCYAHGLPRAQGQKRTEELLTLLELETVKQKKAGILSGGWQRRLSIAMALVSDPKVLFLDEPTLGLDVLIRRQLWERIRSLKGKMTVILTTHYMEEAESLSDRVAILRKGQLLQYATPQEIMKMTGTDRLEQAFIRLVEEGSQ